MPAGVEVALVHFENDQKSARELSSMKSLAYGRRLPLTFFVGISSGPVPPDGHSYFQS